MDNQEWTKLIRLIPKQQREMLQMMTRSGSEISSQDVIRMEEHYLVVRGRLSGTTDQDRIYFIPYDQIVYAGFARAVPVNIIAGMYGEQVAEAAIPTLPEPPPSPPAPAPQPVAEVPLAPPTVAPVPALQNPPSQTRNPRSKMLQKIRLRMNGS